MYSSCINARVCKYHCEIPYIACHTLALLWWGCLIQRHYITYPLTLPFWWGNLSRVQHTCTLPNSCNWPLWLRPTAFHYAHNWSFTEKSHVTWRVFILHSSTDTRNCEIQLLFIYLLCFQPGILGIFQKLLASKVNDHHGFSLIDCLVMHAPRSLTTILFAHCL